MDIDDAARLSHGTLEGLLRAGHFVVTSETTPPLSADPAALLAKVAPLRGVADAVNVTDGAGARSHLSSLAAAALMAREGIEPVLQFTLRDRNRLALQSDLLGAAALGVSNVMCLTGDDVAGGDQPDAKMVHDLDSAGLIALACAMRDQARLPSGREIATPPALLVGAADAPAEPGPDWSPAPLHRKIAAGASFFQTQFCFDPAMLRRYMARLGDEGITERAWFLVGIGALRSAKSARWMNDNLFGVHIPEAIIARLDGAADAREEGLAIAVELLEVLAEIPGVAGAHVMGPGSEAAAAEAIRRAGIRERRAA
jgi:methylenetetrahydrofolate reductase (NADPH)